jgi:1-acyl-sn-glycerol-3-phosphate acyltransferase
LPWYFYRCDPLSASDWATVVTRRWSGHLLKIRHHGAGGGVNPGFYPPNTLLVANHVSWLDIFVLSSCTVSRFVAKREIRSCR